MNEQKLKGLFFVHLVIVDPGPDPCVFGNGDGRFFKCKMRLSQAEDFAKEQYAYKS